MGVSRESACFRYFFEAKWSDERENHKKEEEEEKKRGIRKK